MYLSSTKTDLSLTISIYRRISSFWDVPQ